MEQLKSCFSQFGFALTQQQLDDFAAYEEMLVDWNSRMNLTAITEHQEVCIKHFLDSATLLLPDEVLEGKSPVGAAGDYHNQIFIPNAKVCDVGTGAGFPAIVLKILRPDLQLTLMDSLNKRLVFLQAVSHKLRQDNVFVHARGEEAARLTTHREQYQVVTARAVSQLRELAEICVPLVKTGGVFIAMKGGDCSDEVAEGKNAVATLGCKIQYQTSLVLPDSSRRTILIMKKKSQTSTKYPRITSKIKKSPL